jgi:hypothetical protein
MDPIRLRPRRDLCEVTARRRRLLSIARTLPLPRIFSLPPLQTIRWNPIGPGQRQRARGPLPRSQQAARRPPRRCAIEGSAADAEVGDARAPSLPPPASHPRAAKGVRPTKSSPFHGESRRGVRDLGPFGHFGPHLGLLGALKFGRVGVMSSASVYTRDLRGGPKE